jgi:hypothetical protein
VAKVEGDAAARGNECTAAASKAIKRAVTRILTKISAPQAHAQLNRLRASTAISHALLRIRDSVEREPSFTQCAVPSCRWCPRRSTRDTTQTIRRRRSRRSGGVSDGSNLLDLSPLDLEPVLRDTSGWTRFENTSPWSEFHSLCVDPMATVRCPQCHVRRPRRIGIEMIHRFSRNLPIGNRHTTIVRRASRGVKSR